MPPPNPATHPPARRSTLLSPRWILAWLVVIGLLMIIRSPRIFDRLGQPGYGHWFLDSYVILAASDAQAAGLNPYESIPFDLLKRGHVYSDWWLELGRFGLTRQDNFVFGGSCVLAFLVVALAGVRPRSAAEALGLAAVILSPPILFGLNRANNDLVIFVLIGAPLLLLHRSTAPWKVAVLAAALVAATGLKYYPIVAIAALPLLLRPGRHSLWIGGSALTAGAAVLWSERASMARGVFAFPDSVYLFGSPIVWRDAGLGRGVTLALSAALLGLAAWWLVRRGLTRGLGDDTGGTSGERWTFAVGALLLVGCFLAGTSFAYRWVFAVWLWPWLWRQAGGTSRPAVAKITLGLLLLSLWQDGLYCLVLNLWLHRIPPGLEVFWRYFTQPANWLLIALLTGWLLEAGLHALRDCRRMPAV